jgi:hypothetical protein
MKPHLSIQETNSDNASFSREINLAQSILVEGFVVILCTTLTVIGVMIACSALEKKEAVSDSVDLKGQNELLPCPFCGNRPQVGPLNPANEGDCVGYVGCDNSACPARPIVSHDIHVNDSRGTKAYQARAIVLWNQRAAISVSDGGGSDASGASLDQDLGNTGDALSKTPAPSPTRQR